MSRTKRQDNLAAAIYTLPPQKPAKPRRVRKPVAPYEQLRKRLLMLWRDAKAIALQWMRWLQEKRRAQLASRRLRLCETLSLGEKRFVAIVEVDGQQFLVGGAAGTVSMLGQLNQEQRFANVLQESGSWQRTQ